MTLFVTLFVILTAQTPPATKAEQLQDAARKGDAAAVTRLLDEGVDVNTKFRYGATAIFFACDAGHIDVVKVLLDRGADLTVKDSFYGMTPLVMAVSPARKKMPVHNQIATLLIAKGAPGKDMALRAAVDDDDEALAKAVLDSGGIPAGTLSDALENARSKNKTKTAAVLERAGARPYDEFTIDAAQLARFAGNYRNSAGSEFVITVAGTRLSAHNTQAPPDQHIVLVARDATTFRAVGLQGTTIAFTVEGDKVAAFSIVPVQGTPSTFTRVEGR